VGKISDENDVNTAGNHFSLQLFIFIFHTRTGNPHTCVYTYVHMYALLSTFALEN